MTLKDHVEIIANPVVMAVEEKDGTELYRGYRGCFEFEKNRGMLEREVKKFRLRVEGKRRTTPKDRYEITEANCGVFNYADLHLAFVYVYTLA